MLPYVGHQGNLRPDILVSPPEECEVPEFRVCEINGRFPISFLSHAGSVYKALAGCLRENQVF